MEALIIISFFTAAFLYIALFFVSRYRFPLYQWLLSISISTLIVAVICTHSKHIGFANLFLTFSAVLFLFWKTQKILLSIGYAVLSMIILIASSQAATYITYSSLGFDPDLIHSYFPLLVLHYVLMAITTIAVSNAVGLMIQKKSLALSFDLRAKHAFYLIGGFICVLAYFYYQIFVAPNNRVITVDIAISSFISFFLLAILLITVQTFMTGVKESIENSREQDALIQLQSYTTHLETINSNMKQFKHDYLNIILPLYGYIEAGDMQGLEKYFFTYIAPIKGRIKNTDSELDNLKNMRIIELKGQISCKLIQAQEQGVQVHVEIAEPIDSINFSIVDLAKIIGILIDNAVEACLETAEPVLRFAIIKESNVKIVQIANTFQEPLPPIEDMFKDGFSVKGEKRGLGLPMVRKLIDPHEKALINTFIQNGNFLQELKFMDE